MMRYLLAVVLIGIFPAVLAEDSADQKAMQASVEQLRSAVGRWDVVTELLNEDGSVARSVTGTYEFS